MTVAQRGLVAAVLAAATALLAAPTAFAGGTAWSWSGTASTSDSAPQTLNMSGNTGTVGAPRFHYDFIDPQPGTASPGSSATGQFDFHTTSATTGNVTLDWTWVGHHSFFIVRASLTAYVVHSGTETDYALVNDGPQNCCTQPSGGFSYKGRTVLNVANGDTYGFKLAGSNGDMNATLQGDLRLGLVVDKTSDVGAPGACDNAVAGDCSLRDAINAANASAGSDRIVFDLPTPGVQTINVAAGGLPAITGATDLDATTQPGFTAFPLVELNGAGAGAVSGLDVESAGTTVRGFIINGFNGFARAGVFLGAGSSDSVVAGNYIGTSASGLTPAPNAFGVVVIGPNNTIGGPAAPDRNVISGNSDTGVRIGYNGELTATGTTVQNNFVGVDAIGGTALGNGYIGIDDNGPGHQFIRGNVVSANAQLGIHLGGSSNTVTGNVVGLDATGSHVLANAAGGIFASGSSGTTIGGTGGAATRNIVSGNVGNGITVYGGSNVVVQGNYVGTDASGLFGAPNTAAGILVYGGASAVTVGGQNTAGPASCEGACNLVTGNHGGGIVTDSATGTAIQGNWVGLLLNGIAGLGNGATSAGVAVFGGSATVGGTAAGRGNVVSANKRAGITIDSGTANVSTIQGNVVGMSPNGETGLPNLGSGIVVSATNGVQVGGSAGGAGNLVSGNGSTTADAGILLQHGSTGTVVAGNNIGMNSDGGGSFGNAGPGVAVYGAPSTLVGGTTGTTTLAGGSCAGACNIISRNAVAGIDIKDVGGDLSTNATVAGNFVGTDGAGVGAFGNFDGIVTASDGTTIGGSTFAARNLVADSGYGVVSKAGADGTRIQGNWIGLSTSGTFALGNHASGVFLPGGDAHTVVGGTGAGEGNVISGNGTGLDIDDAGAVVQGNRIGTDPSGLVEIGNTGDGIFASGSGLLVGGTTAAARNVIAANGTDIHVVTNATVQGNFIGVDATGNASLGEASRGIYVQGASGATIGGAAAGAGNVIGGADIGIEAESTDALVIQGNSIGVGANGTSAVGIQECECYAAGIDIFGLAGGPEVTPPLVGGSANGGNIVGNYGDGVAVTQADGTIVQGNRIGLDATGAEAENAGDGVVIRTSKNVTVGGDAATGDGSPPGNEIAWSDDANVHLINDADANSVLGNLIHDALGDGVLVEAGYAGDPSDDNLIQANTVRDNTASFSGIDVVDGTGNTISRNSVFHNLGLGIDLGGDGLTNNDPGDGDVGPNDLQNFPVITSANVSGGNYTIGYSLNSTPNTSDFTIEFFVSHSCNDSPAYGEGERFVGQLTVATDGGGNVAGSYSNNTVPMSAGEAITATATAPDGSTSEFSHCTTLQSAAPLAASISLGTTQQNVRAGAQSVPIGGIDLSALTQGAGGTTTSAPLAGIPLAGINVAGSPLAGIPLAGIGFTPALLNQALGGVHLSDIPLQPPANWPALLNGTPLMNVPLTTLTLADVLALPNPPTNGLTIGQVSLRGTPLAGIPLAGISLGPMQLSAVPLAGIGASPTQNLQAWCDAINRAPGYSCAGATTLSGQTVMSQVIQGVPLAGIPLDAIPLAGIDLSGTPLAGIPLAGINLQGTPLAGIPLAGIDLRVSPLAGIPLAGITIAGSPLAGIPLAGIGSGINCLGGYCANHTLGDAERDGRIAAGATLATLDGHFGSVTLVQLVAALKPGPTPTLADLARGLPGNLTLHDLLSALLGQTGYDWSQINLSTFPLADFSPDGGVAHYTATFTVTGGVALSQDVDIHATVPQGGRYVPHSSTLQSSPTADPDLGSGGGLTWHVHVLVGQQYTLAWDAKPGLALGTSPVSANLQIGTALTRDSNAVQTTVIQTFNDTNSPNGDTNNSPATAPQVNANSLYVSQLTKGDVDYYRVPIGPYGSRTQITLSHIPAGSDYDLTVAGPPAPRLRSAPANNIPLTTQQLPDSAVDLDHRDQQLPPEALQDVPTGLLTTGGNVVRAVSDNRGSSDEQVSLISEGEAGYYVVQVSDYLGDSASPYVLQVQTDPPPDFGVCAPRTLSNGTTGAPAPVNAGTQTLFLVDEQRLISTFGSTATSSLMTKLNALAARTDVNGVVVRVENGPGVAAAYNAWDATPCSPQLANNVVRSIGSYLDSLENTAVNVKYVVVVGGDDIVPFARTADETEVANERTYRESLGTTNNEYLGSIGSGFLLTDDVWGEKGAPTFLGHELFVPEQAVGRLVESPADITKTIDNYTASNGLLTPTSSLVTGYDFLTDGAQSINQPFAAGFGANAKTLISETWDRTAFLNALFPASGAAPVLNSLNAHFDHRRLLPAAENAASRQTNLVTTSDITSRGATIMTGRLGFSLGCHSGLVVSDAIFGAANLLRSDWAQAMLGAGAAGWIGNTGYGLGDTTDVAYSERLHSLFARKLDGTLTVGQALEQAKQDYLGTLAVMSPYDAKVMMEATLYGLPMLRLGSGVPPTPPPPPPLHTDPATNLQATSFDVSPTFTPVTTANGKYYKADNGFQSTPRRPLEPLVSLDVTQPGTLVAHGAMINLLNSPAADETNFNAVFSQVTTDNSADDPTLAGVNTFPSKIQAISTFSGVSTRKQRLNLIVGLFRSDGPTLAGIGTHRRYTRVAGDVLYSTSNDWTPPTLGELQTLRVGTLGNIGLATTVTDLDQNGAPGTVKEVVVLYRDCNGVWRTSTMSPAGGNRWAGGGLVTPAGCQNIDYYLEAADAAGNVAVSSKKVQVEPLVAPPDVVPPGVTPITHTLGGTLSAGGWYTSAVQVTLAAGLADPIHYSLDGAPVAQYSSPFTVTGDGVHFVEATSDRGATHTFGFVIDRTGPTTTITRTPATPDVNGWYTFNVQLQASAVDSGGSDVAQIRCVLDPASVPTSFSQLPASCPYTGAGGNVMTNGTHTVYAAAIDAAGNAGAVVSNTFGLDNIGPSTTINPLSPFQASPSFTAAWTGADGNGSGVKNFDIRYRQAASNSSTFGSYVAWQSANPATSAVFSGTLGSTTCFSGRARDNAGWTTIAYSAEVCTVAPLDDTSLTRSGSWSTVSASDLYNGSVSRSTSVGSTLTSPTMVGKQIGVLVTKQPGGGTIQLRWNGSTQVTQSLSAASRTPKQLVSFTLASVQTGTLQVYVSGAGTVDVDAAGAYKTP